MIVGRLPVILMFAALGTLASCGASTTPVAANPVVQFKLDAVFCGGTPYVFTFSIDGRAVGTDTLTHGKASRPYSTTAGRRTLGVAHSGRLFVPDTVVTLSMGQVYTQSVEFYCS